MNSIIPPYHIVSIINNTIFYTQIFQRLDIMLYILIKKLEKWINKMWHTHDMQYYSVLKDN